MTYAFGNWPAEGSALVTTERDSRTYKTPDGVFPSATTVLKISGLGKEFLIRWAVNLERESTLQAAAEVLVDGFDGGPNEFMETIESRLGTVKEHQKRLTSAGEIGTAIHQSIQHWLRTGIIPEPTLDEQRADKVLWATMTFQDWWQGAGLTLERIEQSVWSKTLGLGGTLDITAFDSEGRRGVVDLKSGKAIYDEHHLQVASYFHMAGEFVPMFWAKIVRIPKNLDHMGFEVKDLGDMHNRKLNQDQLMTAFLGFKAAHDMLIAKVLTP